MGYGAPISELWDRVAADDQQAWADLVGRFSGLVLTVALRCGLSSLDADDCAQAVWIQLFRYRRSIKDPARLPGWLARTTRRRAVRMRSRMRRQRYLDEQTPIPETSILPDQVLITIERQALFELLARRLGGRCRKLIRELFLSPSPPTYNELARQLDVSPNSLGPMRARCLERFKKLLEESGYEVD